MCGQLRMQRHELQTVNVEYSLISTDQCYILSQCMSDGGTAYGSLWKITVSEFDTVQHFVNVTMSKYNSQKLISNYENK